MFEWSLKPLVYFTRIFVGTVLDLSESKTSTGVKVLGFLFGFIILLSNILINGLRGVNVKNFEWILRYLIEGPYEFNIFSIYPDALLQFVVDISFTTFWIYIPILHFIFLLIIFSGKSWTRLSSQLAKIQKNMELSNTFYQKCRKYCLIALLLQLLVWNSIYYLSCLVVFLKAALDILFRPIEIG